MPDTRTPDLLARYLSGSATVAEHREVEAWAEADPAHRRELERLAAVFRAPPRGTWDVEDAWARLQDCLAAGGTIEPLAPRVPARRRWLAAAATALVAVGAGWLWLAVRPVDPAGPLVVVTEAGERRTVALEDGSLLVVAPGSHLTVRFDGDDGARRVDLEGEAFFEVAHDPGRPFEVHAAGTVTTVLGTSFLVQALPAEGTVRVALVSGRTAVRLAEVPATEAALMQPGDLATWTAGDRAAQVTGGGQWGSLLAWRDGRLEFDDAPLTEVRAALARWYGLTLTFATPELATRRFSGTVRLDAPDDALEMLALSLGVRVERRADSVVLR